MNLKYFSATYVLLDKICDGNLSLELFFRDIWRMICHIGFKCRTIPFHKCRKWSAKYQHLTIAPLNKDSDGKHQKKSFLISKHIKTLKGIWRKWKEMFKNEKTKNSKTHKMEVKKISHVTWLFLLTWVLLPFSLCRFFWIYFLITIPGERFALLHVGKSNIATISHIS